MAIKHLSPRSDLAVGAGLPLAIRWHKGAPKEGNRPGPDLTYFRAEFEGAFATDANKQMLVDLYGPQPTVLHNLFLIGPDADQVFPNYLELWGKTGLHQRCDGEQILRHYNAEAGRFDNTPMECTCKPEARTCGEVGRLLFRLPEYEALSGISGSCMLVTHSPVDIRQFGLILLEVERNCQMAGIPFQSVPWCLWREAKDFTIPEIKQGKLTGQRISVTKHMLRLAPEQSFGKRLYEAVAQRLRAQALPAPASTVTTFPSFEDQRPASVNDDGEIESGTSVAPAWLPDFIAWASGMLALEKQDTLLEIMELGDWADLPATKEGTLALLQRTLRATRQSSHSAAMYANSYTYTDMELGGVFDFNTLLPSRFYGEPSQLAELTGRGAFASARPGVATPLDPPLRLAWEAKSSYVLAIPEAE